MRCIRGFSLDASETDVTRGRVDRLRMARGRAIAAAIVRGAEMRPALDNLARDPDVGETAVIAILLSPAARVLWNAARFGCICRVHGRVPVSSPFPDVADHVLKAK